MKKAWIGTTAFAAGLVTAPLFCLAYLRYGSPPVTVTDTAFPMEQQIVYAPLHARIDREKPARSTIEATPEHLLAGASVYRTQCSFCHGLPQKPSANGSNMYPAAPQLWNSHRPGVVGVSDDSVGETYWKVKNGIRLSGMPAYATMLNEQQLWQVSILLSTAAKPRSPELERALSGQ